MPEENRNSNNNSESILDLDPDILTPGMKQYLDVKKAHPDCVVMLRMGDFYEMFYADAVTAARELEITLTARGKGEKKAPLAGIPFHALEPYLGKLVKKGYKVAIVEQLEDPKMAKGLVKRGLVRIVTPGTIIESSMLNEKENNYIMALTSHGEELAVAFCDMSTGEFFTARVHNSNSLRNELGRLAPSECIVPESLLVNTELIEKIKSSNCYVNTIEDYYFRAEKAKETLLQHFNLHNLDAFGFESQPLNVSVSGALLYYLINTQKNTLTHIKKISFRSSQDLMALDAGTIRNLELTKNIRDGSSRGTLLAVLDKTCTVMGARLLKKWLHEPLLNKKAIEKRADAVEELYHQVIVREEIKLILQEIYDIERLISRINYGNANARDILSLRNSLSKIPLMKEKLAEFHSELLQDINATADFKELTSLLLRALRDDAPITLREGGIIKTGYNPELDQLHELKQNSRKYLQALEEQEQQKTGINSLKIGYTNVFGYFIEVTRKNIHLVPAHYIRKQTTANSERYITEELKLEEEKILGAEEKIAELEYTLFQDIVRQIIAQTSQIQAAATRIAVLDVLSSLATVGMEQSYVRPELVENAVIQIKNSRHPVIEKMESSFIANDLFLNPEEMIIITGPNMSGKSTFMRQVALTI
ncbi:MAG: DNA mismatch repair protein MutS [Nanoarchaeota archaeon]|nr:DNA mismatch repair protein MutS [Nanoarchaeota archaeon]